MQLARHWRVYKTAPFTVYDKGLPSVERHYQKYIDNLVNLGMPWWARYKYQFVLILINIPALVELINPGKYQCQLLLPPSINMSFAQ